MPGENVFGTGIEELFRAVDEPGAWRIDKVLAYKYTNDWLAVNMTKEWTIQLTDLE